MKVGFLGLGTLGGPMAGHLLRAGHQLTVWNRTTKVAEAFRPHGATVASSAADFQECEYVAMCVGGSDDSREVVDFLAAGLKKGSILVDHTTIEPCAAIEIGEKLAKLGVHYVDAPVTGGYVGAQKGTLTVFCGGDAAIIDRAKPTMSAYAKRIERVGELGMGQKMKMANQIAVGGALLGLCESLSFAKRAGLDLAQTRDMLSQGAAGSWAFENYGPKILAADWSPGFKIAHQNKDFRYTLAEAKNLDAAVPMTQLCLQLLEKLEHEGHADWTTCALYAKMLEMGFAD